MLKLVCLHLKLCFFFFNDTATTEIYTLSLHDALPISISGTVETRRSNARHHPCACSGPSNAMLSAASFNFCGDQTDLIYSRSVRDVNYVRNVGKWDVVIALDEHHLFGARFEDIR